MEVITGEVSLPDSSFVSIRDYLLLIKCLVKTCKIDALNLLAMDACFLYLFGCTIRDATNKTCGHAIYKKCKDGWAASVELFFARFTKLYKVLDSKQTLSAS